MLDIIFDVDLTEFNTLQLRTQVSQYFMLYDESVLPELAQYIQDNNLKYMILGGGSNLIMPEVYDGLIIHNKLLGMNIVAGDESSVSLKVKAGEHWDNFVADSVNNKHYGLENLSLIPGTVGASPVQNIGAYGVEVKDFIESVEVFDLKNKEYKTLSNADCKFEYRNSILKNDDRYIVTSVTFKLLRQSKLNVSYGDIANKMANLINPSALDLRNAIIETRKSKLPDPDVIANAGSFFHNPIVEAKQALELKAKYPALPVYPTLDSNKSKISAGWLIDNLGLKGFRVGDVGVYIKQALVLVNYGDATKSQLLEFAKLIQDKVYQEYQIKLNIEPIQVA